MNGHSLKNSLLLLFSLLVGGCATARVDYRPSFVPEELGTTFTRIIDSTERVYGPRIILTENGRLLSTYRKWFDISKDGLRLAYASPQTYPAIAKVSVKELTGDKSTYVRTFPGTISDISFLPDCKSVAFTIISSGANWDIKLIGVDTGSAVQRLMTRSGPLPIDVPSLVSGLVFSPDGNSILFVRHKNRTVGGRTMGAYYLWKHDMKKHAATEIAIGVSPSYFPDGRRVLVVRPDSETSRGQLWTVDLQNRHEVLLASSYDWGFLEPAVSPDGKKIAFVCACKGINTLLNFDIAVMNSDGSKTRRLTFHPGHDISPRWSPDGKSIYFLSQRGTDNGQWNIWRMDLRQ